MVIYKTSSPKAQAQCEAWQGLGEKAFKYRAILCDIWGVVHDGITAFKPAVEALCAFKEEGGKVVLISNAPRPSDSVKLQLENFGVEENAYDAILTSGDLTRNVLLDSVYGDYCYHLGPQRDLGLFDGVSVSRVGISEAQFILCTGFENDETQTAEDYREILEICHGRGLKLICANPDNLVERGGRLIPCAGQIAAFYDELGGEVVYFGKPHAPIYQQAKKLLSDIAPDAILAIGDGLETDIKGAEIVGLDSLFILGGIASDIEGTEEVLKAIGVAGVAPLGWMKQLVW